MWKGGAHAVWHLQNSKYYDEVLIVLFFKCVYSNTVEVIIIIDRVIKLTN